jgi:hypothetical protein
VREGASLLQDISDSQPKWRIYDKDIKEFLTHLSKDWWLIYPRIGGSVIQGIMAHLFKDWLSNWGRDDSFIQGMIAIKIIIKQRSPFPHMFFLDRKKCFTIRSKINIFSIQCKRSKKNMWGKGLLCFRISLTVNQNEEFTTKI